jgi:putative Mg2+ transporter-C (MgtC) family protein
MTNVGLPLWEIAIRLGLAVILGGMIGWEREHVGKPAGLRTNMMVALGAATFTLTANVLVPLAPASDSTRIVAGIAMGIGFLGAGSILKVEGGIRGLTTAAGIWVVGAVGAACGAGAYSVAGTATVIGLVILVILRRFEGTVSHTDGTGRGGSGRS